MRSSLKNGSKPRLPPFSKVGITVKISYHDLLDELDRAYADGERAVCEFLTAQIYDVIDRSAADNRDRQSFMSRLWAASLARMTILDTSAQ